MEDIVRIVLQVIAVTLAVPTALILLLFFWPLVACVLVGVFMLGSWQWIVLSVLAGITLTIIWLLILIQG